jgi:hypothetical protein
MVYSYVLVRNIFPRQLYFGTGSERFENLLLKHRAGSIKWYPLALVNGVDIAQAWRSRATRLGNGCSNAMRAGLQLAFEMKACEFFINSEIVGAEGTFLWELEKVRSGPSYDIPWKLLYTEPQHQNQTLLH